jgi:hypothetical protein
MPYVRLLGCPFFLRDSPAIRSRNRRVHRVKASKLREVILAFDCSCGHFRPRQYSRTRAWSRRRRKTRRGSCPGRSVDQLPQRTINFV